MGRKLRVRETNTAPKGLECARIADQGLLERAKAEVESVLAAECAGQIASNQHFFVSFPFPLHGSREAGTAVFALHAPRVQAISHLITTTMRQFGVGEAEERDLLGRMNAIVREYRTGQSISFHVDEQECDAQVFGCIVLNESGKGLQFRRGEGKDTLCFTLEEQQGSTFVMRGEARYAWRHGLPPVPARRISITCRFFKPHLITPEVRARVEGAYAFFAKAGAEESPARPQPPALAHSRAVEGGGVADGDAVGDRVVVATLLRNTNHSVCKSVKLDSPADLKQLRTLARNKLRCKGATQFFLAGAQRVGDGTVLAPGAQVYVSCGEPFVGPGSVAVQATDVVPQSSPQSEALGLVAGEPAAVAVSKEVQTWLGFRYPRLSFSVLHADPSSSRMHTKGDGKGGERGGMEWSERVPASDARALGSMLEGACLSVPELRELVQHLMEHVEHQGLGLKWALHTCVWDTGRSTTVFVEREAQENGAGTAWVGFRVEGQPALKGLKKRDGPLWKLDGGLNNDNNSHGNGNGNDNIGSSGALPAHAKAGPDRASGEDGGGGAQQQQQEEEEEGKEEGSEGGDADPQGHAGGKRREGKGKKRGGRGGNNAYQSKRGVVVTDGMVMFAGTVWPSTYYPCRIEVDGRVYTSAAQFVMAEQARMFGDTERWEELVALAHPPQPHKFYDHKAPKTGQRRVKNFDPDVWNREGYALMLHATMQKFRQNKDLWHRMWQLGQGRNFVEATDDPVWGNGLSLAHPDAARRDKWRGGNKMGLLLDDVRQRLLEELGAPQ